MKQRRELFIFLASFLLIVGCTNQKEKTTTQQENVYEDVSHKEEETARESEQTNNVTHPDLVHAQVTKVENEQEKIGANPNRMEQVQVVRNIDGDTLKVRLKNGKEESVRFLLVDTPETKHPKLGVQLFGPEASAFTKQIAPVGKDITLELDVSEREKYGRLLAYVWVEGQLIEQGLARVGYIYAPNTKYVDYLREIQTKAQQAKRGIWSVENYATEKGFNTKKVEKGK
jgi:micrococcal nuclease